MLAWHLLPSWKALVTRSLSEEVSFWLFHLSIITNRLQHRAMRAYVFLG